MNLPIPRFNEAAKSNAPIGIYQESCTPVMPFEATYLYNLLPAHSTATFMQIDY